MKLNFLIFSADNKFGAIKMRYPRYLRRFEFNRESTSTRTFTTRARHEGIEPILTKKKYDYNDVVSRRIAMLRYGVKKSPHSKPLYNRNYSSQ